MLNKTKKVTIMVPAECSLDNLNDAVVRAAGKNPEKVSCDFSNLVVSRDVYNAFKAHIESLGWEQSVAEELWSKSGLSISESLTGGEVDILQDGIFDTTSTFSVGDAIHFVLLTDVIHILMLYCANYFDNASLGGAASLAVILRKFDVIYLALLISGYLVWLGYNIARHVDKNGYKM